uniref:Uncharacterized protein n=1 Tax=Anguilla anguilla TaxID=7936 RepID=A0A0E9PCH1_ANGAN
MYSGEPLDTSVKAHHSKEITLPFK